MEATNGRKESTPEIWRNFWFDDLFIKYIIPEESFVVQVVSEFRMVGGL